MSSVTIAIDTGIFKGTVLIRMGMGGGSLEEEGVMSKEMGIEGSMRGIVIEEIGGIGILM